MKEILKWIAATALFITAPIWIVPAAFLFVGLLAICGIKDAIDRFHNE